MIEWWQIKDSLDVPEVLDNLGINVARVDGNEHFASCPLSSHVGSDANPSFSVNDDMMWYFCFTCGEGGSIPAMVMDIEKLSWNESLVWLTEYSDEVADEPDAFARQVEKHLYSNPVTPQSDPLPWFGQRMITSWVDAETDWFDGRGISNDTREYLRLGFDPQHERRTRSIVDPYVGPAVIVPHFFDGQLCGWQERWLDEDRPEWIGKYTNTYGFPKGFTLYNYENAVQNGEVIVVEGTLTVARLVQLGYNAVSTFGATVASDQWKLLAGFDRVILSFDNDDPGYKAMEAGVRALGDRTNVWVVDPPQHKKGADLGDIDDDAIISLIGKSEPGFMRI